MVNKGKNRFLVAHSLKGHFYRKYFGVCLNTSCEGSGLELRTRSYIFLSGTAVTRDKTVCVGTAGRGHWQVRSDRWAGWFVSVHVGRRQTDGFPKPHEKAVVLEKPELGIGPNHSRNMAWDLGWGGFFAHHSFVCF